MHLQIQEKPKGATQSHTQAQSPNKTRMSTPLDF
jgi:hypothetical protein